MQVRGEFYGYQKAGKYSDRYPGEAGAGGAGLTQEGLAELLDVTAQYLSGVERGAVGLSVPILSRLCSVLLVPSDFILTGDARLSDVTGITARLSRLPPEHIKNVEELLNRYMEGIAIEQHSKRHSK